MSKQEDIIAGKLLGKTTTHTVNFLIVDKNLGRNDHLVIYTDSDSKEEKDYYLFKISDIWNDKQGLMATIKVLGHMPKRPFKIGSEVYLAKREQIIETFGIDNPEEDSLHFGTLLGYSKYDVRLLVKNFGRIFITGKSGSGKSYTMGVLIEEFLKKGIPIVIFDRHGEYSSLKISREISETDEEIPNEEPELEYWDISKSSEPIEELPSIPSISEAEIPIEELEKEKISPSEFVEKIIEFADLNMNEGADVDIKYLFSLDATDLVASNLCTIINFRGLPLELQEVIANNILMKLYNASTSKQIQPFYLFIDEAHLFAGKKKTDISETVKIFAQEGRKFGANLVISTQKPQLLDVTIRGQAGTWIIHQLTDIRDVDITISSAEDLGPEYKEEIQRLDPGECIICGDAVKIAPLFLKIRKRKTEHGGIGFNPLDFLSKETIEDLKKKRLKILEAKSEGELVEAESLFQKYFAGKYIQKSAKEIALLTKKIEELDSEVKIWKDKYKKQKEKANKATKLAEKALTEAKRKL